MKGSYILLIGLPEKRSITIGRLGVVDFPQGFYAYIGSAMNGLETRVGRHLQKMKKLRWHIDYLLVEADIWGVVTVPGEQEVECSLAQAMSLSFTHVSRFGSGDCRCPSHLFFTGSGEKLKAEIFRIVARLRRRCLFQTVNNTGSASLMIDPGYRLEPSGNRSLQGDVAVPSPLI